MLVLSNLLCKQKIYYMEKIKYLNLRSINKPILNKSIKQILKDLYS